MPSVKRNLTRLAATLFGVLLAIVGLLGCGGSTGGSPSGIAGALTNARIKVSSFSLTTSSAVNSLLTFDPKTLAESESTTTPPANIQSVAGALYPDPKLPKLPGRAQRRRRQPRGRPALLQRFRRRGHDLLDDRPDEPPLQRLARNDADAPLRLVPTGQRATGLRGSAEPQPQPQFHPLARPAPTGRLRQPRQGRRGERGLRVRRRSRLDRAGSDLPPQGRLHLRPAQQPQGGSGRAAQRRRAVFQLRRARGEGPLRRAGEDQGPRRRRERRDGLPARQPHQLVRLHRGHPPQAGRDPADERVPDEQRRQRPGRHQGPGHARQRPAVRLALREVRDLRGVDRLPEQGHRLLPDREPARQRLGERRRRLDPLRQSPARPQGLRHLLRGQGRTGRDPRARRRTTRAGRTPPSATRTTPAKRSTLAS